MAIVPSGTKKLMVAQTMMRDEGLESLDPSMQPSADPNAAPQQEAPVEEQPVDPQQEGAQPAVAEAEGDGSPDLTEYIFKKLEELGYPPRRLEEFEKEFISEKIFSGGVKEVAITLPDRYYGTRKRISDEHLGKMVNEIQKTFGLAFVDAERKDKRIIINFSSQKPESENDENAIQGDILDEVYGNPEGAGAKKKKPKQAGATLSELIKESKSQIVEELLKRIK
jgi:hypothetical protein